LGFAREGDEATSASEQTPINLDNYRAKRMG